MPNIKAYIDVNFTIEEGFSDFTDVEIENFINNRANIVEMYKRDLLYKLSYYAHNIKDLNVVLSFEEESDARE